MLRSLSIFSLLSNFMGQNWGYINYYNKNNDLKLPAKPVFDHSQEKLHPKNEKSSTAGQYWIG